MSIPTETQLTLDRLVERSTAIMVRANAESRDLTDAELRQVKDNAAEFDAISAKARFAPEVQGRADLRDRLRFVGLSKSAADRVAAVGWPTLSHKSAATDAVNRISAAAAKLRSH